MNSSHVGRKVEAPGGQKREREVVVQHSGRKNGGTEAREEVGSAFWEKGWRDRSGRWRRWCSVLGERMELTEDLVQFVLRYTARFYQFAKPVQGLNQRIN
jgi:hypothetical protein